MFTGSLPHTRSPSLEALTRPAALEALRPEWERLWRRAGATPFQSPAWLLPWWKHVGRGVLAGVAVRDATDGELIGLAPLYVFTDAQGTRHLFPLGIATSDQLDALALPGREDEVARAIVRHAMAMGAHWDVFEAPQLRMDAVLLRGRWPAGWRRELREDEPHPVLALPAPVRPSLARAIAYGHRRAAQEGGLSFEIAGPDNVHALLDALAALHAQRWARRQMPGVLGGPGVLAWHREAAPQLLAQGLLRLVGLRCAGHLIGVAYGLVDPPATPHRRWHVYIGGFDPRRSALSPGTLLLGHAIEQAGAEGAAALDFLRGAEVYKYRWGAIDEPMFALRVGR